MREICPACNNPIEDCDCFTTGFEPECDKPKAPRGYGLSSEPLPGIKKHGVAGYSRGCRCDACREAKRLKARTYKKGP